MRTEALLMDMLVFTDMVNVPLTLKKSKIMRVKSGRSSMRASFQRLQSLCGTCGSVCCVGNMFTSRELQLLLERLDIPAERSSTTTADWAEETTPG